MPIDNDLRRKRSHCLYKPIFSLVEITIDLVAPFVLAGLFKCCFLIGSVHIHLHIAAEIMTDSHL